MEFMESDVRDTIQQQQKKQQQEQGQPLQQHFHVLAVDDSHTDMKLLEKLLRFSSYQVTCVDSGNKALAYLGLLDNIENIESPPSSSSSSPLQQEGLMKVNLIMTDYCMPGINGYDLLKRVKGSTLKDVPVVIMSSENVPSRITMCLEGGAEKFLLKPLQLSDLEKLQPCLLKYLHHNNIETSFSDNKNKENENNYNNNSKGSSNNNSNNNTSKRKAVSPEPSERRPKMKELAVV